MPKYVGNEKLFAELTDQDRKEIDRERRSQDLNEWIKLITYLQKNISEIFADDEEAKILNDDARLRFELQKHLYKFVDHIKANDCVYSYLAIFRYIPPNLAQHTLTFLNKFHELYEDGFKPNKKHCEAAVMAMIDYYNPDLSGAAKCALGKRYDHKLKDIDNNLRTLYKLTRHSQFERNIMLNGGLSD